MCSRLYGVDILGARCKCLCVNAACDTNLPRATLGSERVNYHIFAIMSLIFNLNQKLIIIYPIPFVYREKTMRIYRLGFHSMLIIILALFFWLLDKFFCDMTLVQKFPYFHALWHVLIFIGSYRSIVLCAYYVAKEDHANLCPELQFWPINELESGIPFVTVKCYYTEEKRSI